MRKTTYVRMGELIYAIEYELIGRNPLGQNSWRKIPGSERVVTDKEEIERVFGRGE